MTRNHQRLRILWLTLAVAALQGTAAVRGDVDLRNRPPGVVIDHVPASQRQYIGSPSIAHPAQRPLRCLSRPFRFRQHGQPYPGVRVC